MSSPQLTCPKCQGEMEQGFILDSTHGGVLISHWAAGHPNKSFWFGTQAPAEKVPIGVYRCAQCGYLESYAQPIFAPK